MMGKRAVAWSRQRGGIQNGHGRLNAKGKGVEGGTQFSRLRERKNGRKAFHKKEGGSKQVTACIGRGAFR
jgi:hypothetical protein